MEGLREILKKIDQRLGLIELHLGKSGFVSAATENKRHTKALKILAEDYAEDRREAKTRDERNKARFAYETAVKDENEAHERFYNGEPEASEDEDGKPEDGKPADRDE